MTKKRILIIEDEVDIADMVAMRFRKEGFIVEIETDGIRGLQTALHRPYDVLILDLMLHGLSGIEILKQIRADKRLTTLPIIILSAKGGEGDIVLGLEFGADDYLPKPFQMSILVARINALLRRTALTTSTDSNTLEVDNIVIDLERHQVEVAGESVSLTKTEFQILVSLVLAKGRVLTRNQLIEQAIGEDALVTDRTIDVHLNALRNKLGESRSIIQTVRGVGYKIDY
ncbi:MAG: response regulator transcription factor [Thermoguttaceae bacterium]